MKKINILIAIFLMVSPLTLMGGELLNRVVAVVNDDVITQSELDVLLRGVYEQYKHEYSGRKFMEMMEEARQKILNQLIEDRLVYQEAIRQEIEINEKEINKEMEAFENRFGGAKEVKKLLESERMTEKELREKIEKQALIRYLHDIEIRSKVVVSPLEIEEYYKNAPEEFSSLERVRVRSFTIRKSEESREKGLMDEEARLEIDEIYNRIQAGEDFSLVVKDSSEDSYADGGGMGDWINRGEMIEAIDNAIFQTKIGIVTDIIETPIGYHFFKVEEKEKGGQKTFEEVRDQIRMNLFLKKSRLRFDEWMEELKRNAYISIK